LLFDQLLSQPQNILKNSKIPQNNYRYYQSCPVFGVDSLFIIADWLEKLWESKEPGVEAETIEWRILVTGMNPSGSVPSHCVFRFFSTCILSPDTPTHTRTQDHIRKTPPATLAASPFRLLLAPLTLASLVCTNGEMRFFYMRQYQCSNTHDLTLNNMYTRMDQTHAHVCVFAHWPSMNLTIKILHTRPQDTYTLTHKQMWRVLTNRKGVPLQKDMICTSEWRNSSVCLKYNMFLL